MNHGLEVLTQQVATGEWNAASGNVAVIDTAEAFVRWPGLAKNGGELVVRFHGSYSFNNASTITEDVWLFLSVDGVVVHTFKLLAIASTPAGFGVFDGEIRVRSSGVARQEVFSTAQVANPSNAGGTVQTWRQVDRYTVDFSVDRRVLLSFQKQASTTSQFNVRSVDAFIRSRKS